MCSAGKHSKGKEGAGEGSKGARASVGKHREVRAGKGERNGAAGEKKCGKATTNDARNK